MSFRTSAFGLAAIAMLTAPPAFASDGLLPLPPDGFKTPSNNIVCLFDDTASPVALRCDMGNLRPTKLRPPKDCNLGWGDAFALNANGNTSERMCHGDTIMHEDVMVLPYGKVWQHGAFTCRSEPSGLTCFNAQDHGFSLSRSSQRLF
jgi:hypothetical protein